MEHHKIFKLLNDSTVSKFVRRKWIEVNDLSGGQYSVDKSIGLTLMLRSDLCDYSDGYIVVKGRVSVRGIEEVKEIKGIKGYPSRIMFYLDHPYKKSISHLYTMRKVFILWYWCIIYWNIVTIILSSGSLWNYYRDEVNDTDIENNDAGNYRINNNRRAASIIHDKNNKKHTN